VVGYGGHAKEGFAAASRDFFKNESYIRHEKIQQLVGVPRAYKLGIKRRDEARECLVRTCGEKQKYD
jgi:hypothetical protein